MPFTTMAAVITPVDVPTADVTGDCRVDHSDLLRVIEDWGTSLEVSDIDGGGVGFSDLVHVLNAWQ